MSAPVALVTGAAGGIGRAAAVALAREGFAVALNALADDAGLDASLAAVREAGGTARALPFDVADVDAHADALAEAEGALGPLTTLVNNAGIGVLERGDPLDVGTASYDRCQAVNARAVFFLTQAFARRLLGRARDAARFHSVVNVTSANAEAVALPRTEYCVSKAAASMVTRAFAARLGPEDVAVYEVRPGLIRTAMTAPVMGDYERRASEGLTLQRRVGEPEEVGRVIATLAAGALPHVTGQTIAVDGGMLLARF